jgi:hypothetical protein
MPWSQPPQCIDATQEGKTESYCVFVKKDFAEGRGISIITTPAIAKTISELLVFKEPDIIFGVNDLAAGQFGPPGYRIVSTGDKGMGLLANRTISRGERIMQESVPVSFPHVMMLVKLYSPLSLFETVSETSKIRRSRNECCVLGLI